MDRRILLEIEETDKVGSIGAVVSLDADHERMLVPAQNRRREKTYPTLDQESFYPFSGSLYGINVASVQAESNNRLIRTASINNGQECDVEIVLDAVLEIDEVLSTDETDHVGRMRQSDLTAQSEKGKDEHQPGRAEKGDQHTIRKEHDRVASEKRYDSDSPLQR